MLTDRRSSAEGTWTSYGLLELVVDTWEIDYRSSVEETWASFGLLDLAADVANSGTGYYCLAVDASYPLTGCYSLVDYEMPSAAHTHPSSGCYCLQVETDQNFAFVGNNFPGPVEPALADVALPGCYCPRFELPKVAEARFRSLDFLHYHVAVAAHG